MPNFGPTSVTSQRGSWYTIGLLAGLYDRSFASHGGRLNRVAASRRCLDHAVAAGVGIGQLATGTWPHRRCGRRPACGAVGAAADRQRRAAPRRHPRWRPHLVGIVGARSLPVLPSFRWSATSRRWSRCSCSAFACAAARRTATRACAVLPATKKVILIVIDGLTPSMFEAAETPALRFLADHGEYRRAASTFPSLTPVCLSSIATGGHPDTHHIPHLVWWNRDEDRLLEYGSSFAAVRVKPGSHCVAPRHDRRPEREAPPRGTR